MPKATPRRFIIVDDCTIREARDRQEESRPRKRQRVDDDAAEGEVDASQGSSKPKESAGRFVRDEEYYVEESGADHHIVSVGRTLFKLRAQAILRCLKLKLLLDDHIKYSGITSDGNPLEVAVASLDEFRALIWALNATQEDLDQQPREYPDVDRILLIATAAQAFEMSDLHNWAIEIVQRATDDNVFMDSCSSATLAQLVAVGNKCKRPEIVSQVAKKWAERVFNKKAPSVPAMQAADKHELLELRGISYYIHVQDMIDRQTVASDGMVTQLRADPKLNNGQVMRLLSGYWSLVSFWERFRLSPLELPCSDACSAETHRGCTGVWERRWISAVGWKRILGYSSADVLGLLGCLRDQLSGDDDLRQGLNASCRLAGLDLLKQKLYSTKNGLAAHFFGCV